MPVVEVALENIRTDGGTQSRERMDDLLIEEYKELYEREQHESYKGDRLPPVKCIHEAPHYWLYDGFQRVSARKLAGFEAIPVDVIEGTLRDAILLAAGQNSSHGSRRTIGDKVNAITLLLRDTQWANESDNWIAEKCSVPRRLVATVRERISTTEGNNSQPQDVHCTSSGREISTKRKGKDGKLYSKKRKPKGREPGDDTESEKAAKKEAKNGSVIFNWDDFFRAFGQIYRKVDDMSKSFKAKDSPAANGLRRRLAEWKKDFKKWFKQLSKTDAPKEIGE